MEIERKFLVRVLPPNLEKYPKRRMEQAYLCVDPVIRVRRDGGTFVLTVKGNGLMAREESEFPLTENAYSRLLSKADGFRIVKDRYRIPHGAYIIELDVFAEAFAPLCYAEVEFADTREAEMFAPPDWFGREVTHNPAYTNAALSRHGLPPDAFEP